jgi:hypothetical protein
MVIVRYSVTYVEGGGGWNYKCVRVRYCFEQADESSEVVRVEHEVVQATNILGQINNLQRSATCLD